MEQVISKSATRRHSLAIPNLVMLIAMGLCAGGIARLSNRNFHWVVYDLENKTSIAKELNQGPFQSGRKLLLYGSNTRDDEGNSYVAGRTGDGPILLKIEWPRSR